MDRFWRPAWVEVNIDAIQHNIQEVQRLIGKNIDIIGVIKGDAYGHGAVEMARQLSNFGVKRLAVATVDEGVELRENGVTIPVLVLGYTGISQLAAAVEHDLSMTLHLKEMAEKISDIARHRNKIAKVHIKVNTGMNRIGILPGEAKDFFLSVQEMAGLKIEGIFTHFASAGQKDKTDANRQLKLFKEVIAGIKEISKEEFIVHTANSGATMEMPDAYFDAVRPGRLIYGLYPYPKVKKVIHLQPALQVKCEIAQINQIPAGEGVGYEAIFRPSHQTTTATLPIGFTDGVVSKRTIDQILVIIGGQKRKVVAVCADMCMVDLGSNPTHAQPGDMVTLIGTQDGETITVDEIAGPSKQSLGGVLSHLSRRLPRIYLKKNKPYLARLPFEKYENID